MDTLVGRDAERTRLSEALVSRYERGVVLVLAEEGDDRADVFLEPGAAEAVAAEDVGGAAGVEAHRVVEIADGFVRRASVGLLDRLEAQRVLDQPRRDAHARRPARVLAA